MAFPAVPRNAKSYDIENAINRILRWLNPGFGSDNAGKVLASNSNGTDLEWVSQGTATLTTRGDLLTRDAAGLARLAIGADGTFLSSDGTDPSWKRPTLSYLTSALASNVTLNNTTQFFTGPSVAQGTSGIWLALGTVTCLDTTGAANFSAQLWDGGSKIAASALATSPGASQTAVMTLVGVFDSPAGNIRISVKDTTFASGVLETNVSGSGKDCNLTVLRIG